MRRWLVGMLLVLGVACESTGGSAGDATLGAPDGADVAAADDAPAPPTDVAADDDAPAADDAPATGGCDGPDEGWDALERLAPADFAALVADEAVILVNVHVPYAGELPGTDAHIAYTDVDALVAFVGPDPCAEIALYCYSDPMSLTAGNTLIARGYRRVRDLRGGMIAWRAAGYPVDP